MTENQILFLLIGFGTLVVILFVVDIYFLSKGESKKEKEKGMVLGFSEEFILELEKSISQELTKRISLMGEEMVRELSGIFKKEVLNFSQKAQEKLSELEKLTKEEITKTRNFSSQTQERLSKEIERTAKEMIKDLKLKVGEDYKIAFESLKEEILKTKREIEEYKKERMKEIDRRIYQLIGEISKKIIGKTLDISTHENLVLQILEKAKKEIF